MRIDARYEIAAELRAAYWDGTRATRSALLDHFCAVTGYNRNTRSPCCEARGESEKRLGDDRGDMGRLSNASCASCGRHRAGTAQSV